MLTIYEDQQTGRLWSADPDEDAEHMGLPKAYRHEDEARLDALHSALCRQTYEDRAEALHAAGFARRYDLLPEVVGPLIEKRVQAERAQAELRAAALALMPEWRVTTGDTAKAAGVSRQTLYNWQTAEALAALGPSDTPPMF